MLEEGVAMGLKNIEARASRRVMRAEAPIIMAIDGGFINSMYYVLIKLQINKNQ